MGRGKILGSRNQKQEPEQLNYKPQNYTPPPPPPGNEEAWELQFCKWWGWNWVQKDNLNPNRFAQQPDDRTMSKSTCDYFHQVRPPPLSSPPPMQQMYPQRRIDRNTNCFKDLCNCIFSTNRQRATESLQRLYSTPSNSVIYQQALCSGNKDGCFDSFSCLEMRNNLSRTADKNFRNKRIKSAERSRCRCPPKSQDRKLERTQRNCCMCKPPAKPNIKDQCTCQQPKECGCISNTSTLSEGADHCCGCSKKKPSDQSCKCKTRNPKWPMKIDCPCQTKKPEMKCSHAQTAEIKPNNIKYGGCKCVNQVVCECCCHCTCREVKNSDTLSNDNVSKEKSKCEYCEEHCKEHAKKNKKNKKNKKPKRRPSSKPIISKYKLYPELRKKEEEEERQRLQKLRQQAKQNQKQEEEAEEEEDDEEEESEKSDASARRKSSENSKISKNSKNSKQFTYYMFGEPHQFKPSINLLSKIQDVEPKQNNQSREEIDMKPIIYTTNMSCEKPKEYPPWNGIAYNKTTIAKSNNEINSHYLDPLAKFYTSCQNIPRKKSDTEILPNRNDLSNLHKEYLYQNTSNQKHAHFLPNQQNCSFKHTLSCQDVYNKNTITESPSQNVSPILTYEPTYQYQNYSHNIEEFQKNIHSPYQEMAHSTLSRSNQYRSFKNPNMRESPENNKVHISTSQSYFQHKDLEFIGEESHGSQSNCCPCYRARSCKTPNNGDLPKTNSLLFSPSQAYFQRNDCQIATNTGENQFSPIKKNNPCKLYPSFQKTPHKQSNVKVFFKKKDLPLSNSQPYTNDIPYNNGKPNQVFSPCSVCQLEKQSRNITCPQDLYFKKSNINLQNHQINISCNKPLSETSVKQVYSPTLKLSQCKCPYKKVTKETQNYDFQSKFPLYQDTYKSPYIEGMFNKPSYSTNCRPSQCSNNNNNNNCPIHPLSMHCFQNSSSSYDQMDNHKCPFCSYYLDLGCKCEIGKLYPNDLHTKQPFEKYVQVPDRTPHENLKKQKSFGKSCNYPSLQSARSEILDKCYRFKLNEEYSSPASGKIYDLSTQTPCTFNDYKNSTLPDPMGVEEDIKYLENLEQRVKEELKSRVLLDVVCDAILFKNNGKAFETETETLLSKYSTSQGSDIRDLYKNDLKREPDTNNGLYAENLVFENHFMKKVEAVVKKIINKSEADNNNSDSENNFKITREKNKHKRSGSPFKTEPIKRFKHVDVNCPSSEESLVTQVNNFNYLFEKMDKIAKESSINVAKIQGVIRSLPRPDFGINSKVTFENNQTNSEMMEKLYEVVINTVADETVIQNIFDIISNKNTEKELKKRSDTNLSTICETSGSVQQKNCDEFSETWSTVSSRSQISEEKKIFSSIPRLKRNQKIDNKENRREKSEKKSRYNKKSKSMIPIKK